nr:immunoglobulin light chain junction region [Macaca mulatta]
DYFCQTWTPGFVLF